MWREETHPSPQAARSVWPAYFVHIIRSYITHTCPGFLFHLYIHVFTLQGRYAFALQDHYYIM